MQPRLLPRNQNEPSLSSAAGAGAAVAAGAGAAVAAGAGAEVGAAWLSQAAWLSS